MEGVQVEGLIDVLILSFGLAVGRAVVAWVIQGVDLTIFTSRDKRVFFNWIQVFCSNRSEKGGGRVGVQRAKEKLIKREKQNIQGNKIN